jgi:flagellar hook-basal body complex protein FliE
MILKQDLAEQLKAQSDICKAQAKEYQQRLDQAGEQARAEYKKAIEQMEAKIQDAAKLAERIRSANEAAWKDMATASQKAFVELQRGWADACPGSLDHTRCVGAGQLAVAAYRYRYCTLTQRREAPRGFRHRQSE